MIRTKFVLIGVALVLLLAACKGDDKKKPTATPSAATPQAGETFEPLHPSPAAPLETPTPYLMPPESLFQEASSRAQVELATRLNLSIAEIKILDPDAALLLPLPLQCPEITAEGVNPFYLYAQYDRFLYPYQFYAPADGGEAVVEPCEDVLEDQDMLYVPTPDYRQDLVEKVKADLQARGIDAEHGTFTSIVPVTWPDEALGCRVEPDDPTPASAYIEGYRLLYVLDGTTYEYHTDTAGERVMFCAPPPANTSAEEFIDRLRAVDNLDVTVVENDPARYQGLDAEGVRVELTSDAYRIGVFAFDTPQAARDAAQKIDDADVSHIFVSGQVLIVQEENSLPVYSTLLHYAEEVRTPILERQDEAETPEAESSQ
jgi:hypothetical protein